MNANELADKLQKPTNTLMYAATISEAADMLRQQQAEIEALKDEISTLRYEKSSGVYDDEPVAWMNPNAEYENDQLILNKYKMGKIGYDIPLYTHPSKDITDEDIAKVVHELNKKANTPERWVTAMQIAAETIIQLRDELRKANEK